MAGLYKLEMKRFRSKNRKATQINNYKIRVESCNDSKPTCKFL